jgi:nuclear pore complex protein Nup155
MIFLIADTHDAVAISTTWSHLIDTTHAEALEANIARPFEAMIEKVRNIGFRVRMSETVFPVREILPLLEQYKFELQRDVGPPTWVVDLFLELEVAHETIYSTLESILYNNEAPFMDRNRRVIGNDLVYLIGRWFMESGRGGAQIFGSDAVANEVSTLLQTLQQNGVTDDHWTNEARMLRARIEQLLR